MSWNFICTKSPHFPLESITTDDTRSPHRLFQGRAGKLRVVWLLVFFLENFDFLKFGPSTNMFSEATLDPAVTTEATHNYHRQKQGVLLAGKRHEQIRDHRSPRAATVIWRSAAASGHCVPTERIAGAGSRQQAVPVLHAPTLRCQGSFSPGSGFAL